MTTEALIGGGNTNTPGSGFTFFFTFIRFHFYSQCSGMGLGGVRLPPGLRPPPSVLPPPLACPTPHLQLGVNEPESWMAASFCSPGTWQVTPEWTVPQTSGRCLRVRLCLQGEHQLPGHCPSSRECLPPMQLGELV